MIDRCSAMFLFATLAVPALVSAQTLDLGVKETVEISGDLRIDKDTLWKDKRYRVHGNLILASHALRAEDAVVEIACDYARQYAIRWEDGTLVTRNCVIGGRKTEGVTRPTVFELYDGLWTADDTEVQYSCGILFSYATKGRLEATHLRAGENPDSVIVCGRAEVIVRDSVFDMALHLPGSGGGSTTLDLPVKEPLTRVYDKSCIPGVDYRLELTNTTIPTLWFLFFVNVVNSGDETRYNLRNCPNIVAGFTAVNLKGTAHVPCSWSGTEWPGAWTPLPANTEVSVGTLRVVTLTNKTVVSGWGVYLDGKDTDVTIAGSTAICELMVTGGTCRVQGAEGTHDICVTCTTTDAKEGAHLLLRNVNLAYEKPTPHYKQITVAGSAQVVLENVVFGDRLMLIADHGDIDIRGWRGNRAGVSERTNGGNIHWQDTPRP